MGILFTKLWRLFNHQGKNGAVTFIIKLSKTWELSGLDGQKRPSLKGRSAPLLAWETAFNIWHFIARSYFSVTMSFAVTLFFIYLFPQRSHRVDNIIIVISSINWLRMSFSALLTVPSLTWCYIIYALKGWSEGWVKPSRSLASDLESVNRHVVAKPP